MTQIIEDYVSFETAKLLKEKGFNEVPVYTYYLSYGGFYLSPMAVTNKDLYAHGHIAAPTIQMAMKWLREVHNLHVEVYRTACGYLYIISKVPTGSDLYTDGDAYDGDDENSGQWSTYEKACEAAIKYCLENLI